MNNDHKKKKTGTLAFMRFAVKNARTFKAYNIRNNSRTRLSLVNHKIGKLDPCTALYFRRIEEFNRGMVFHAQGKWYATRAMEKNNDDELWKKAFAAFKKAARIGKALMKKLSSGDYTPLSLPEVEFSTKNTEICFADDVPLVPDITPVVVLKGNSREMGAQYAAQLIEIFGKWILELQGGKNFTPEESTTMDRWEEEYRKHTPELPEFCAGWVEGASSGGVTLSYREVLDMWVGPKKPTGMTKSLKLIFDWFSGKIDADVLMAKGMLFAYWNSYNRNLFLHTMAENGEKSPRPTLQTRLSLS